MTIPKSSNIRGKKADFIIIDDPPMTSWWVAQGEAMICRKCHEEIPPLGDYKKCPFHEDCPDCSWIRIWDAEQDIFYCGQCGSLEPVMP